MSVIAASNLLYAAGLFKIAMNWKLFSYLFSMCDGTGISAISSGFGAKCDWHIYISYLLILFPACFVTLNLEMLTTLFFQSRSHPFSSRRSLAMAAPSVMPTSPLRTSWNEKIDSICKSQYHTETIFSLNKGTLPASTGSQQIHLTPRQWSGTDFLCEVFVGLLTVSYHRNEDHSSKSL